MGIVGNALHLNEWPIVWLVSCVGAPIYYVDLCKLKDLSKSISTLCHPSSSNATLVGGKPQWSPLHLTTFLPTTILYKELWNIDDYHNSSYSLHTSQSKFRGTEPRCITIEGHLTGLLMLAKIKSYSLCLKMTVLPPGYFCPNIIVRFTCPARNVRLKVKYFRATLSSLRSLLTPQHLGAFWSSCYVLS
jgi:hypothetical protein